MSGLQSKERFKLKIENELNSNIESEAFKKDIRSKQEGEVTLTAFPLSRRKEVEDSFLLEEIEEEGLLGSAEPEEIIAEPNPAIENWIPAVDDLIRVNDVSAAHSVLQKVFAKDPYNIVAMELLASCFLKEMKFEQSLQVRLEMERLGDVDFHNLSQIGHLYYDLGQDIPAGEYYERSILMSPSSNKALFEIEKNLGNIYLKVGDMESCEEHYNRAFVIDPHSDVLLVNYGTLEIQKGEYAKALRRFRTAVDANSVNDKAWMGLALVHRQYGDIDLSWGNLERSLDINPGNETAIQMMMDWGVKDNQLEKCIPRLDAYLALYPDNLELVLVLAKLFYCTNRFMQASLEVERVLAQEPNNSAALNLESMIAKALSEQEVNSSD